MGNIDENNNYVTLCDADGTPAPLLVDPSTGWLLLSIKREANLTSTLNSASFDDNHQPVSIVEDSNGDIKPLQVDNRNDRLYLELN